MANKSKNTPRTTIRFFDGFKMHGLLLALGLAHAAERISPWYRLRFLTCYYEEINETEAISAHPSYRNVQRYLIGGTAATHHAFGQPRATGFVVCSESRSGLRNLTDHFGLALLNWLRDLRFVTQEF